MLARERRSPGRDGALERRGLRKICGGSDVARIDGEGVGAGKALGPCRAWDVTGGCQEWIRCCEAWIGSDGRPLPASQS